MPAAPPPPAQTRRIDWLLVAILVLATGLRLWGLTHDLPFSYFGDELHLMKRSIALGSGDLNPHWFNKPGFLMYVLLFCYGLYFLAGSLFGRFGSTEEFAAHFLTDHGPFLLIGRSVVLLAGVALVLMVYLLGRRGLQSRGAGLIGALMVAVLPSLVVASQAIKADAPCALFMALSVYLYLSARGDSSVRGLILAGLAAGAAMGTKYCGIILMPVYLLWEVTQAIRGRRPWKTTTVRAVALTLMFVVGFFITSPYNFLDPSWGKSVLNRGRTAVSVAEDVQVFNPDSKIVYQPGVASWAGATAHFFKEMRQPYLGGLLIQLLTLLGLVLGLRQSSSRSYSLLVLLIVSIFLGFAVALFPFHVSARHLSVLVPLTAPLVGFGIVGLAKLTPAPQRMQTLLAATVGLAICLPSLAITIRHDRGIMRYDSRTLARDWIVDNLSSARILVEDEGPTLNPGPPAVARMQADLTRVGQGSFTRFQKQRLDLLSRFPPADGLDIDRLGHPWWLNREIPADQLRTSYHTNVGNPLVQRIPSTLADYRSAGIEYVVTNGKGQRLMRNRPDFENNFPAFARFYDELSRSRLIQTFDPDDWNGKGPVVWIYDIRESD